MASEDANNESNTEYLLAKVAEYEAKAEAANNAAVKAALAAVAREYLRRAHAITA
jgi:hypothetical protein